MTHDHALDTLRRRVGQVLTSQMQTLATISTECRELTPAEQEAIADASSDLYLAQQRLTKLLQEAEERKQQSNATQR